MSETNRQGTALITGASSGIGAVYADRFAKRGYDLLLVARNETRLNALAEKLRAQYGVAIAVLSADLATEGGVQSVERKLAEDSSVTVLINNAGLAQLGGLTEMKAEQISAIVQVNVHATTRLAAAAARAFVPRKAGRIVNIASVLALVSEQFNPVYNASKAYLLSFSQTLQTELEPQGVHVQVVLPGATRTEIWENSGADISMLPPDMVMGVDEMVDAALVGFDREERVTIPALPDESEFEAFTQARLKMGPNLSRSRAADRYR